MTNSKGILGQDELLIGKLNREVEKNVYTGGKTSTAIVHVDNKTNIITVDNIQSIIELEEEIKRAKQAEYELGIAIENERAERLQADNQIIEQLAAEETRAKNAEEELNIKIDNNLSEVKELINQESAKREEVDNQIKESISEESQNRQNADDILDNKIESEITRAKEKEESIDNTIINEISKRQEEDNKLNTKIDTEIARAKSIEEELANTDELIEKEIDEEIDRAISKENEIDNKLENYHEQLKQLIDEEVSRATDKENNLENSINELNQNKADKSDTYTKTEVDELVDKATPHDYGQLKAQVASNTNNINILKDNINEIDTHLTSLDTSVNNIEVLIPNQASQSNQLADKAFVNSSIETSTANFIGTFDSVNDLPTTGVTNNDYAFIKLVDETTGLVKQYDRYKYSNSQWKFEYTLNNSSFTAEQWAAINSSITKGDVEELHQLVIDVSEIKADYAKASDIVWEKGIGLHSVQTIGNNNNALGESSVAEGAQVDAHSYASHAEGYMTSTGTAADYSHAEGYKTSTQGMASHAEGDSTVANNNSEHAEGKYNRSNMGGTDATNTIHSVGIGNASGAIPGGERKNAEEIMFNGDQYILGIGGYDGKNFSSAKTIQEVINNKQDKLTSGSGIKINNNQITYDPDVLSTVDYVDMSISDTLLYVDQQDASEHAGRVAGDNLLQAAINVNKGNIEDIQENKADKDKVYDKEYVDNLVAQFNATIASMQEQINKLIISDEYQYVIVKKEN